MWAQKFFKTVSYKPMDAIGFILAVTAVLAGIYLYLVAFHVGGLTPQGSSSSAQISGLDLLPAIFGTVQVGLGTLWVVGLFNKDRNWSLKVRRACSLTFFYVYMFYGFTGVILNGLERASWITTFALAAVTGVKYLWLSVAGDGDDDGT